jgi:hypothetical protein
MIWLRWIILFYIRIWTSMVLFNLFPIILSKQCDFKHWWHSIVKMTGKNCHQTHSHTDFWVLNSLYSGDEIYLSQIKIEQMAARTLNFLIFFTIGTENIASEMEIVCCKACSLGSSNSVISRWINYHEITVNAGFCGPKWHGLWFNYRSNPS